MKRKKKKMQGIKKKKKNAIAHDEIVKITQSKTGKALRFVSCTNKESAHMVSLENDLSETSHVPTNTLNAAVFMQSLAMTR